MRSLERARYLLVSNSGRNDGWFIELDGRVVGELEDPRFEDMFWYSYAVKADFDGEGKVLLDGHLWKHCRLTFRNRKTGELILTQELSSQLKDADQAVRVRDASGRVIGFLLPEDDGLPIVMTPTELETLANRLADDDSNSVSTSELLESVKLRSRSDA